MPAHYCESVYSTSRTISFRPCKLQPQLGNQRVFVVCFTYFCLHLETDIHSNIAAVEAQHSDQGLLPTGGEKLILALPRYQMTGGGMPLILYRLPMQVFNGDVTGSGLLSRGWVFQEIMLSPANLFCTKDQLWWSCERASHSETLPAHPPNLNIQQPVNQVSSFFTDGIRETRHWLQAREGATKPVKSWTEVLRMYSRSSVTFKDDRMVALKGISELFRHIHSENLGETDYHSGLWSVDVLQQLLWSKSGHVGEAYTAPPQVIPSARPIPTWSALRDPKEVSFLVLGPGPTCEDWIMLPNRFVSMSTACLDRFGRAAELTSCQIHLQGILISIDFPEVPEPGGQNWRECVAYPRGHEDVPMTIVWDNYQEQRLAGASLSAVQPLTRYRALPMGVRVPDKNFDISGLLLRSVTDKEDPKRRSGACLWMRCAFFHRTYIWDEVYWERDRCGRAASAAIDPTRVHEIELAFQLNQRYGLRWEFENAAEDTTGKGSWQQVSLHDADLEDLYIV